MSFHHPPQSAAYPQQMPPDRDDATPRETGADIESRYPVVAVWRNIFQGIFSVLGRLAALAQCRDRHTRRYSHEQLANELGLERADDAMRIVHGLVWRDWIFGSVEQQHPDILLHLSTLSSGIEHSITLWLQSQPFLSYPPDSASQQERILFISTVRAVLELLEGTYCCPAPQAQDHAEHKPGSGLIEQVLCFVHQEYADPHFSLATTSEILGISERQIARVLKAHTGMTFTAYVRQLRLHRAEELLVRADASIKDVCYSVGYTDVSWFARYFKSATGLTPSQFQQIARLSVPSEGDVRFRLVPMSDFH